MRANNLTPDEWLRIGFITLVVVGGIALAISHLYETEVTPLQVI
jgi:hypothetical protein